MMGTQLPLLQAQREPDPVWPHGPMFTKRRVVILALAVLLMVPITSIWVRAAHPRDEADFLLAVGQAGASPVVALDDVDIVREGDFACQWLDQQDRAFLNHGPWLAREGMLDRYVQQTRPVWQGGWGQARTEDPSRRAVADAAWSQLCGGTWWWHRPHGPSLRGDGGVGGGD